MDAITVFAGAGIVALCRGMVTGAEAGGIPSIAVIPGKSYPATPGVVAYPTAGGPVSGGAGYAGFIIDMEPGNEGTGAASEEDAGSGAEAVAKPPGPYAWLVIGDKEAARGEEGPCADNLELRAQSSGAVGPWPSTPNVQYPAGIVVRYTDAGMVGSN